MEARADAGLAYMLQYEHVAWYEDGAVHILDRRVYPRRSNTSPAAIMWP